MTPAWEKINETYFERRHGKFQQMVYCSIWFKRWVAKSIYWNTPEDGDLEQKTFDTREDAKDWCDEMFEIGKPPPYEDYEYEELT